MAARAGPTGGQDSPAEGPDRPYVAVVGAGAADDDVCRAAEAVGRGLAQRGAVLVCGGLGGVMEAACRGARGVGGITVGILPGDDRADANTYVDVAIATGLGEARNALVVRAADSLVAVSGGYGTLSEIALALRVGTPVVGVGTWALSPPGDPAGDPVLRVDDPDEAAARAVELALSNQRPTRNLPGKPAGRRR